MLNLETGDDLQSLIDAGMEESLTLDYKASPALARSSDTINELCKDVSAMANSAGGQIVYGIEQDNISRKPERVDNGVADPKITREWIDQILASRISPRMNPVRITRVQLSDTPLQFGFVIAVEPTQIGPHQAPDKKYYRRFDLHSVPMEDYEIRDVMRRSTTPNLYLRLQLRAGSRQQLQFTTDDNHSDPIILVFTIGNRSLQPAANAIVTIGLDARFTISSTGDYDGPLRQPGPEQSARLRLLIRAPEWMPIFKEAGEHELSKRELHVRIPRQHSIPKDFIITGTVQTPGFSREYRWKLTDNEEAHTIELSEID